jgi:ATP:ADP antiporter, AAA family
MVDNSVPAPSDDAPRELSGLERFLRLFTDLRAGEGVTGLVMLANVFLLLSAYYLIKPAREGLLATAGIDSISKTELKAYTSFGQSLLLLGVIPFYARLSSRLERRQLVSRVTLFFISNLVVFWALQPGLFFDRVPYLGLVFYLWVGIFNNLVVAQFWSFAADVYTEERGKRLFPMIAIGASAGAVVGSWMTDELVARQVFGTFSLLLLAGGILLVSIGLTLLADKLGPTGTGTPPAPDRSGARSQDTSGAFGLVFQHRYLIATAFLILVLNWVNTNGENLLYGVVQNAVQAHLSSSGITDAKAIEQFVSDHTTGFYGNFQFWTNLVGLLMQALLASRLLKYGGFGAILLLLPVISLVSYSTMALLPILEVIKAMKIAENATDYSVNNTAKQVLWLPTSREMKYKAKAAIDTIFVRLGDGMAAVTAFVAINRLRLPIQYLFALNVSLVVIWLVLGIVIVRENRRLVEAGAAAH